MCLSIPPLLIRTPVTGFRVHPEPVLISLNLIICTKTLFPKSHSRIPTQGVGTSIKISGRHMSTYSFFFFHIYSSIYLATSGLSYVMQDLCIFGNRLLSVKSGFSLAQGLQSAWVQ